MDISFTFYTEILTSIHLQESVRIQVFIFSCTTKPLPTCTFFIKIPPFLVPAAFIWFRSIFFAFFFFNKTLYGKKYAKHCKNCGPPLNCHHHHHDHHHYRCHYCHHRYYFCQEPMIPSLHTPYDS